MRKCQLRVSYFFTGKTNETGRNNSFCYDVDVRIKTPCSRSVFLWFSILTILSQPLFTIAHYSWNEAIGAYPPNSDTIIIPVTMEILTWIICAPLLIYLLVRFSRSYPGSVSVAIMNRSTGSKVVTVLTALIMLQVVPYLFDAIVHYNLPLLLNIVLLSLVTLYSRALIVYRFSKAV